jgi:hypothetical protein
MGTLKESERHGKLPVKSDRVAKHKGGAAAKVLKTRDFLPFCR